MVEMERLRWNAPHVRERAVDSLCFARVHALRANVLCSPVPPFPSPPPPSWPPPCASVRQSQRAPCCASPLALSGTPRTRIGRGGALGGGRGSWGEVGVVLRVAVRVVRELVATAAYTNHTHHHHPTPMYTPTPPYHPPSPIPPPHPSSPRPHSTTPPKAPRSPVRSSSAPPPPPPNATSPRPPPPPPPPPQSHLMIVNDKARPVACTAARRSPRMPRSGRTGC